MKRIHQTFTGLFLAMILVIATSPVSAQRLNGNKNVVSQERTVENFTGIDVGGAFVVYLTIKDQTTLKVEADENLLDAITTKVKGDRLYISSSGLRNATKLNIYVTVPEISNLNVSGAARIEGSNTITSTNLDIIASGASEVRLDIDVEQLKVDASGASDVKLTGSAGSSNLMASGAAHIKAKDLVSEVSTANASGASSISVNSNTKVTTKTSGAGDINVYGDPAVETSDETVTKTKTIVIDEDGETTRVTAGNFNVEVIDGDSTTIVIGNRTLIVDDDGDVSFKKIKRNKFNGHWGGFDLGINGYVDSDFNIEVPDEYSFLDLKYEKSIDVSINFYEQNINLVNNKFGMITGLGLRWNNYRLDNNIQMVPDSVKIYGYPDTEIAWEKSKIVANYLTVPLLFEYQTNRHSGTDSFHVTAGMMLGWRFRTYTKMMNQETGRNVEKIKGESFHMNPFRYDAMARIGWGVINLYATYSLNTLFQDNQGPELYPFAIGITLVGW
ncbi:MAG: DUF2807 domain-containing protein [Bacteroidales bacterium]|nr:DUF2807 domain-containing protein [Bacteroidales bacterium]